MRLWSCSPTIHSTMDSTIIALTYLKDIDSTPDPPMILWTGLWFQKQRPFSGQNSRTTVGTPTVTVLGVVPKQKPFSGHPSLAINLSLCEIASTRKDVWNFFDYQPICDKQQPAPTGSNQHPPASTSTHRRQPVPNCIHEHHPAPPSTHLPPSPPITHHCP